MKKTRTAAFLAVSVLLAVASRPVLAQTAAPSNVYLEVGYAALGIKGGDDEYSVKASPGVLTGIVGYQLAPNFAVEGLLGLGLRKDGLKENGVDSGVDVKVSNTFGLFIKPSVALSESVDVFARVGFLRTTLKASDATGSESGSESGLAYGFGANFNLSKTSYIQANWMNYFKEDGIKANGFGVAYGIRF